MMDSDAPTTGKPNATRFVQNPEMPGLIENVKQHWLRWAIVLLVAIFAIHHFSAGSNTDSSTTAAVVHAPVPVAAVAATQGDLNQYINAIGTVTAYNTVTIKSRVDGQLDKVNFTEGQIVKAGDVLAEIDPRPYQVQLEQAQGSLAKDVAQRKDAQVNLDRYKLLFNEGVIPKQQLDTQDASVSQFDGAIQTDQATIDNAKLNLVYCRITAPISGRVGLRLVDAGNMIHATDANGLVVITQLQPITVLFSLPQDQ